MAENVDLIHTRPILTASEDAGHLNYAIPDPSKKQPFSLIPFLWLTLIICVVAFLFVGLCFPIASHSRAQEAKLAAAHSDVAMISEALAAFSADTGRLPTTAEGLDALFTAPSNTVNWHGPYLLHPRTDPWGHPYIYLNLTKTAFDLRSSGPDGKSGTWDDILQPPGQ